MGLWAVGITTIIIITTPVTSDTEITVNGSILTNSFQTFDVTSRDHVDLSHFEKCRRYDQRRYDQITVDDPNYYEYSHDHQPDLKTRKNTLSR